MTDIVIRKGSIADRLGMVIYWIGIGLAALNVLAAIVSVAFGLSPFVLLHSILSIIPWSIGWCLRWLLTGRMDIAL